MMKVESVIECYEVDGKEPGVAAHPRPSITVKSHWNRSDMIVLQVGEHTYTVVGSDLDRATANAGNVRR